MTGRPVLIVDDEVDHAVIARLVIASIAPDATVETCTDSRVARARLIEAPPSAVVLIDRILDGVASWSLVAEVAVERPDLYLVLLSSSLSEEDEARALRAGAAEAAEKPRGLAGWRALLSGVLARAAGEHGVSGSALAG